jgi:ABC-2 type transport system ATP-binding protein
MLALSINNLKKTYQNGFHALKGINLEVQEGDFFALLGANGAGKSTTIGVLTSLIRKTSGELSLFGVSLDKNPSAVKAFIGLVPQEFNCNIFESCEQILINQAGFYGIGRKKAKESTAYFLEKLGLWDKRDKTPRELSGGMKRRLMIARALIHHPRMLILDEPSAGVDVEIRHSMWAFLKELNDNGTTIILTTHYLEEAEELCRHIAIIDKGEIIESGSMQTILKQCEYQRFILELEKPIETIPDINDFKIKQLDDFKLELKVDKTYSINDVFKTLSNNQIEVTHLRNKGNRLENLFLSLINNQEET